MKVITEEEAKYFREHLVKQDRNIAACAIDELITGHLEEIDTLTVSRLRPMVDAPKDEFIMVFISDCSLGRESYTKDGITFYIDGSEIDLECLSGWVPATTYKPEKE